MESEKMMTCCVLRRRAMLLPFLFFQSFTAFEISAVFSFSQTQPRPISFVSRSSKELGKQRQRSVCIVSSSSGDDYDDWINDLDPAVFDAEDDSEQKQPYQQERGSFVRSARASPGRRQRHDYERDYDADSSNVDEAAVDDLISERLQARKTGQFETADAIRDQLLEQHGVRVLDKERMWRTGCSASGSGRQWGNNNNDSRRDSRNSRSGNDRTRGERDFPKRDRRAPPSQDFGPNGKKEYLSMSSVQS